MAVKQQTIKNDYALYNGDCIEVAKDLPDESIHLSIYSLPFCGMYHYSSSERDLSNCDSYEGFFEHYKFVVQDILRLTKRGRCTAVHCMDIPTGNSGCDSFIDFPGDIIRLHQQLGFDYIVRHSIWKEPLTVRNRTMQKNLAHKSIVTDSILCGVAIADTILIFRKKGENEIPVAHPTGFDYYAGQRKIPNDVLSFKNYQGDQKLNRYSHWIWRQYASSIWDDIRLDHVLPFRDCREDDDEKHIFPLQLDAIDRIVIMRSNPGEVVLTPFMGVGSEVFSALVNDRRGIGIELKESYYRQAVKNMQHVDEHKAELKENPNLFDTVKTDEEIDAE